ncbi:MAG: hypothetical protein FJW88_01950 [Actinobacteria bacterium]|nr:hypothetical protein [Actinomycetota bacterium]
MYDLLARVLPLAVGAAFSPTMLTVLVIVLGLPRYPRTRGVAFAIGAALVLVGITVLSLTLLGHRAADASHHDLTRATVDLVAAALLTFLGIRALVRPRAPRQTRPDAGDQGVEPLRFLALGMVMMITNFSTIILYVPAMREIVAAPVSGTDKAIAVTLTFVITTTVLWLLLACYLVAPSLGRRLFEPVDRFITRHARTITVIVCFVFAAYLGIEGVDQL